MDMSATRGTPIPLPQPTMMGSKKLPVPPIRQQQRNWCWAACADMVLRYFNIRTKQCELANFLFNRESCCEQPANPATCNRMATLQEVDRVYKQWNVTHQGSYGQLEYDRLRLEIVEGRPVQVAWNNTGGGHIALVVGWDNSRKDLVLLNDPARGRIDNPKRGRTIAVSYEFLKGRYLGPTARWTFTWSGVQRRDETK